MQVSDVSDMLVGLSSSPPSSTPYTIPTSINISTLRQALSQRRTNSIHNAQQLNWKDFGLKRWQEYAVLKHGDSVHFQRSKHGRRMIKNEAIRKNNEDLKLLREEVSVLDHEVLELELEAERERLLKKEAEYKFDRLEREREDVKEGAATISSSSKSRKTSASASTLSTPSTPLNNESKRTANIHNFLFGGQSASATPSAKQKKDAPDILQQQKSCS
tara:strand:- start:81 stop:731 length:651 start_codon:yes stop_codon:yes gene_type:complete